MDDSLNERSAEDYRFLDTLCYLKTISATGGEISQAIFNRNLQIIRFFAITRTKRLPSGKRFDDKTNIIKPIHTPYPLEQHRAYR